MTDPRFIEPAAVPRLIAPSSLARVTVQRPRLVWTQSPGGGTASVELCKDRACTMPIGASPPRRLTLTGPDAAGPQDGGMRRAFVGIFPRL